MTAVTCPECGKTIRLKFLFGTMHLCLSPEQRAALARERYEAQFSAASQEYDREYQRRLGERQFS